MKRQFISSVLMLTGLRCVAAEAAINEPREAGTNGVAIEFLVREALERNPELNFYKAEIAAAKGERRTAGTLANPELAGQLGAKHARNAESGLGGEGLAWSVSVQQTFEYPGRMALRKAIANRQIAL